MKEKTIQKNYQRIVRRMVLGLCFFAGMYHTANADDFATGTVSGKVWKDDNTPLQ